MSETGTAEDIAKKYVDTNKYGECRMGCMSCSADICEAEQAFVRGLSRDIEEYHEERMKEAISQLKECKLQLEYLHEKFTKTGTTETVLSRLDNFLNKQSDE